MRIPRKYVDRPMLDGMEALVRRGEFEYAIELARLAREHRDIFDCLVGQTVPKGLDYQDDEEELLIDEE